MNTPKTIFRKAVIRLIIADLILIAMFALATSCIKTGEVIPSRFNEVENLNFPPELKGLKIYTVGTSTGFDVKVAVLNNEINSVTYSEGKTHETTIIINGNKERVIHAKEILSENDSIIVIKK